MTCHLTPQVTWADEGGRKWALSVVQSLSMNWSAEVQGTMGSTGTLLLVFIYPTNIYWVLRSSQSKLNAKAVWMLTFKSVKWHIGNVTVLVCFFIWGREWALTTRLTWKGLALHGMTSDFTLLVCHTALMCQQAEYRDDAVCAVDPWKFPFRVEERGVALRKPWRLTEMFSWPFTESAGVPLESITLWF